MYYVYLIQSEKNQKFYAGFAPDLKKRLEKHNAGKVQSTKAYIPHKLIYFEGFRNKKECFNQGKETKASRPGNKKIERKTFKQHDALEVMCGEESPDTYKHRAS